MRRHSRASRVSIALLSCLMASAGTMGAAGSVAVASPGQAPRAAASLWHVVKRSETWGLSFGTIDCTSQLRCVEIANRKGITFAVRLDAAGIVSVSRVATRPIPGSLSCTTSVICQGQVNTGSVESSNYAMSLNKTTDAGVHWTRDARLPDPVIRGFACSTPTRCLATTSSADSFSASSHEYMTADAGVSWSETTLPPLPSPYLETLDCGIGGGCIAVNRDVTNAAAITTDLGKTWKKVVVPVHRGGVASGTCVGSSVCQLVIESPGPGSSARLFLWTVAQSDGRTVALHPIGTAQSWGPVASCGTKSYCSLVVDPQQFGVPQLRLTSNSGATWRSESLPAALGPDAVVWCGAGGHCLGFNGGHLIEVRN
jgi:hypothetical protein